VTPRKVIVTDGEQRSALAVTRSLGRAGHQVLVASARARCLAGGSRYARQEVTVPDPLQAPAAFAERIGELAGSFGAEAIFPVTEPSVLALLEHRAVLGEARLPYRDLARFRQVSDKAALLAAAPELGITAPSQEVIEGPASIASLDPAHLQFPLVLKPARSVSGADGSRGKFGVTHAADAAELRARLAAYPAAAYPVLLQQRVVGPGIGIFLLVWRGETRAVFAHRRIREKPPAGGVSVYRESIAADPGLVARSRALLDRFGWEGVAMIEYKVDAATGTPYLMEINGRFWGSLQLAIDAGVDFPRLLLEALFDEPTAPPPPYREGVRSRWWWGDVDHLLLRLRRSDTELALPPGSPSRLQAVGDFLKLWRPGDRNEILRLGDFGPFIRETRSWLRGQ
jgi:predicted ATP-grasp superfamily ATP-dependent carboligase